MTTANPPTKTPTKPPPTTTPPDRLALNLRAIKITPDQFLQLCADNHALRLELTADSELIIMPPTGLTTGNRNSKLTQQLANWSDRDGTGITFDSSAGFTLPNGAVRAPDASWLPLSRWQTLTPDQQAKFAPICPDFVIELRSPSDDLPIIQTKMSEYINNGARLGWLIDPQNRQVHIYRPNRPITILNAPTTISADPELPGFTLNLQTIW